MRKPDENRSLVINNHPAYLFGSLLETTWEGGTSSPEACRVGAMPLATNSDLDLLPDLSVLQFSFLTCEV